MRRLTIIPEEYFIHESFVGQGNHTFNINDIKHIEM
jgi:hypothetical protein